jgi:hypothetical protein
MRFDGFGLAIRRGRGAPSQFAVLSRFFNIAVNIDISTGLDSRLQPRELNLELLLETLDYPFGWRGVECGV